MLIAIDGPAASGKGTLRQAHRRALAFPILTPASSTAQLRAIPWRPERTPL